MIIVHAGFRDGYYGSQPSSEMPEYKEGVTKWQRNLK